MIANESLRRIILSSTEDHKSGFVVFSGLKGTLKLFSSEILLENMIENYERMVPFSHPDIYIHGTYDVELYYKALTKNQEIIYENNRLLEFLMRFLGFCISHKGIKDQQEGLFESLSGIFTKFTNKRTVSNSEIQDVLSKSHTLIKNLSRIKNIGIETIRDIINFVSISPISGKKFVIISEFEQATQEAQNAFLKTLEEPPPNIYIILTSSDISKILPTIRSRAKIVQFLKIPGHYIKSIFTTANVNENYYYSLRDIAIELSFETTKEIEEEFLKILDSNSIKNIFDFSKKISEDYILIEYFFKFASKLLVYLAKIRGTIIGLYKLDELNFQPKELLKIARKFTISKILKLQSLLDESYNRIFSYNINPEIVLSNFLIEILS